MTTVEARIRPDRGTSDDDRWAEQWARHRGTLVRYVGRLLAGDMYAAEDVVQETAIRLWQHPEILDDGRPVEGWLRTVARNIVVDRSRRRGARPTEVALTAGVDGESVDDLDHVHDADSVAGLLSGLSPRHRDVVLEVYVRDRPVVDVAGELGIPTGTVKSRCHTALRRLRATPLPAGVVTR